MVSLANFHTGNNAQYYPTLQQRHALDQYNLHGSNNWDPKHRVPVSNLIEGTDPRPTPQLSEMYGSFVNRFYLTLRTRPDRLQGDNADSHLLVPPQRSSVGLYLGKPSARYRPY